MMDQYTIVYPKLLRKGSVIDRNIGIWAMVLDSLRSNAVGRIVFVG